MVINLDIKNTLILIIAIINITYGAVIYFENKKNATSIWFFLLTISVGLWGVSMLLFRSVQDEYLAGLFARGLYISAAIIPLFFIYFSDVFPSASSTFDFRKKYILPILFWIIILLSLLPGYLINGVEIIYGEEKHILFNSFYHTIYVFYINIFFTYGYLLLVKKYLVSRAKDAVLSKQIIFIIAGTLVSTMIGVSTNLLGPYFGIFNFNWVGQIGVIVMISAISYTVMKHHLFNIKLIVAELLTFAIWIAVLTQAIIADTFNGKLLGFGTLFFAVVLGIFLIKSVKKEVAQREQIEELVGRLKSVNRIMSHDIKNVLGKNKDMYDMLLDGTFGVIPNGAKPFLERLLCDTKQLVRSVISILESGQEFTIKLVPFDAKVPILEIINDVKHDAEEKGLIVKANIDEKEDYTILGDEAQLSTRVFRNLIENAVNYTLAGSVTVGLVKKANNVLFTVTDTGVGITEEDQKNLFQEGGHGKDSLNVNVHSTGYGLFSAKKVVDAHKGKIWFETVAGKGTTFFVEVETVNS